jgi:DNA replication and repair protein RecF
VHIAWIQVLEFRNYPALTWSPSPKLNILIGPNAQGKTNLLEALGFLLTGRSFRTARLGELPRWGTDGLSVAGELARSDGSRVVRRALEHGPAGAWLASGEDCPWARAVAFGWQDLEILHGAPAARRSFLDGFAARLFPGHRPALLRYRQILARRNLLLQRRAPEAALAPWDEQLAEVGMELIGRRRRALAALQTEVARLVPCLTGERHKVELRYRSTVGEAGEAEVLRAALGRDRARELRRGQTLVGPHRDDVTIELDGVDLRLYGSRGQQRLVALALRLAEVLPITEATGTAPVLLLDDALSELDARGREHVVREVQAAEQVFLTTSEPLAGVTGARWAVHGGGLIAA